MSKKVEFQYKTGVTSRDVYNSSQTVPLATTDSTRSANVDVSINKMVNTVVQNNITKKQGGFFNGAKNLLYNIGRYNAGVSLSGTIAAAHTVAFLTEPQKYLPAIEKINWIPILETIDDMFNITEHSLLENAGYSKPTEGALDVVGQKIAYTMDHLFTGSTLSDKELTRAVADYSQQYQIDLSVKEEEDLKKDLISDKFNSDLAEMGKTRQEELAVLQEEMQQRPMITDLTKIPYYKDAVRKINSWKTDKPSWWGAEQVQDFIKGTEQLQNYIGPVNTGNVAADYLLNGSAQLIGSIGGSVATGMVLGRGFGALGNLNKGLFFARHLKTAKAYEKMSQFAIAAIQTSGESSMEGQNAAKMYREERIFQIAGDQEINQKIKERTQELVTAEAIDDHLESPTLVSDNKKRYLTDIAKEQVLDEFIAENPQYRKEIDRGMAKAFEITTKVNSLNILFNWFSAGLYMRGKFPTRNILAKPQKWGVGSKEAYKGGWNEAVEEGINQVANKAGLAAAHDKYFDVPTNVLAMDVLESALWGYVGGHGEVIVSNKTSYKSRLKQYNAQQKYIIDQDRIGSATQANIEKVMGLDSSYEGLMKDQLLMNNILAQAEEETNEDRKKALHESASMVSDAMLTTKVVHANESGTIENLIKNYKQVAANEDLIPEVRQEAEKAIQRIEVYEKIYNDTRKYHNANDVFYTRAGIKLVEEASDKTQQELIDLQVELLLKESKRKEAGLTELTVAEKELQEKIDKQKAKFTGIQTALEKFKKHEQNLSSPAQQVSSKTVNNFWYEITKMKNEMTAELKKTKNEDLNVFTSKEYQQAFDEIFVKHQDKMTVADREEIHRFQKEKKEGWDIVNKVRQRDVINAATKVQLDLANETLAGETSPELKAQAEIVSQELSQRIESGEISDEFLDWTPEAESDISGDPKITPNEPTDEQKQFYERAVRIFYDVASEKIENPSIEDVIRVYGRQEGMFKAEQAVDVFVQGWKLAKLPGYETLDTMKLFTKMFLQPEMVGKMVSEHLDILSQVVQTPSQIQESEQKDKEKESESVYRENTNTTELDKNGAEVIPSKEELAQIEASIASVEEKPAQGEVSIPGAKLDLPSATVSFKSLKVVQQKNGTYKKIDSDLNQGEYAPDMVKLLFHDHNNVGTVYTAKVPSDFTDRNIKIFNEKGIPTGNFETFGEWVKRNNVNPDSQEYRNRIPIILVDSDGDVVGMVHDIDRITEDKHTFETVDAAKEATIKMRNAVIAKKETKVKVNHKYMGHPLGYYDRDHQPFLSEADPTSGLAIAMSGGLEYDKIALNITDPEEQIKNAEHATKGQVSKKSGKIIHPNVGALYELRRIGVTESGKPKYFALRTNAPQAIGKDIQDGLTELVEQYIHRHEKNNKAKYAELMKELFRTSYGEIDMRAYNETDAYNLDKYLSQFITVTPVGEGESEEQKISKTIQNVVDKKESGTEESYLIFTVNGKLVIAVAHADNSELSLKSAVKSDSVDFIDTFKQNLDKFRPNASNQQIRSPHPVMLLSKGKWVKRANNYTDYLRSVHTTANIATKITATFNGKKEETYVSYIQPTMGIELVEDTDVEKTEYTEATDKHELSDDVAEKIAQKKFEKRELTAEEALLEAINPKKVEELLAKKSASVESSQKLYSYRGGSYTADELRQLQAKQKEKLGYAKIYIDEKKRDDDSVLLGDQSGDPVVFTKEYIRILKESQHTIDKLFQVHQRNIVEFIFNNVSPVAKVENDKIKNIGEVKKYIKTKFDQKMEDSRLESIALIKEQEDLIRQFGIEMFPDSLEIIERSQQNLELIEIVKKHWKVFEEDAILMTKKFHEIGGNKNNAEPDGENDGSEPIYEDGEDRNSHALSKTAEEVNHKERVSADVRIFCQGIERKDAEGNTITGIFGIPLYVGYDTVFDTVSALLADMPSDSKLIQRYLNDHRSAYRWMGDFVDKLFPENLALKNESLQNEVIRHMTKHALDMEFVMFQKNRNGTYALKIYSSNSTAIVQNLKQRWESTINTSKLFDIVNGEYVFNLDKIDEVLKEYEILKGNERKTIVSTEVRTTIIAAVNDHTKILRDSKEKEEDKKNISTKSFFEEFTAQVNRKPQSSVTFSPDAIKHIINAQARAGKDVTLTFEYGGSIYIAERDGQTNRVVIKPYESPKPTGEALILWLKNFGIEISKKTAKQIINDKFIYDAKHQIPFKNQWIGEKSGETYSLLGALAGTLNQIKSKVKTAAGEGKRVVYTEDAVNGEPYTAKILRQTVIESLAKMEAKHTEHRIVSSFYDNNKPLYGFTVTKYITDRINDIKGQRRNVEEDLRNTTYNKNSFWLDMLTYDDNFYTTLLCKHLGLTALKEQGKKMYRDNSLQKLSLIDHELVKLGMFMNTQQGDVSFKTTEAKEKYKGIGFRVARMFSPTMSDKSTATMIRTNVINYNYATSVHQKEVLEFAFSQLVMPDLTRIVQHGNIGSTNVKSYDDGAKLFYFLPRLNSLKMTIGGVEIDFNTLIKGNTVEDILKIKVDETREVFYPDTDSLNVMGKGVYKTEQMTVKDLMVREMSNYMEAERDAKLKQWEKAGFIIKDEKGVYVGSKFLDYEYLKSRDASGNMDDRIRLAAMDYTLNSMIFNANSFMMIAGDPAQFFKRSEKATATEEDHVEATFSNITKRLASQIAPGDKIADSDVKGNEYIQLQLKDVFRISDNIKMIVKANDHKDISDEEIDTIKRNLENAKTSQEKKAVLAEVNRKYPNSTGKLSFFDIESTNAQEYTTWREHLYVLEKLGKSPNYSINVTQDDIDAARQIFKDGTQWDKLTPKQKAIVGRIVQPMKPVYTGQIHDAKSDLMRFVYIKSSSFPLIPQLTAGMELDKLRQAMENMEAHAPNKERKLTVRASFESANKVGSVAGALSLSDIDGNFKPFHQMPVELLMKSSLILPRSGFRIQQNVPYKSALNEEDVTTLGTQPTKLLFGNGVMDMKGFQYYGEKDGTQLQKEFFKLFDQLVEKAKNDLFKELGLDPVTYQTTVSPKVFFERISNILRKEAILRGFPKQDIKALGINLKTGQFEIPLWMSPNSQKFEALLTSIISHRIAKIKFPGYSYVVGSENGFKVRTDEEFDVKKNGSQLVFTDAWNGSALKPNQVLIQSKFRVNGKLIDLIKDGYAKEVNGKWMLDTEKVDTDLLEIPSFRIPTSKHSSMEKIEIAGFLPPSSADLIIVSRDGTVAMGEDYDVDKRYTYHLWTTVDKNGKIVPLDKKEGYQRDGKTSIEVIDALIEENNTYIKKLNDRLENKDLSAAIEDILLKIAEADEAGEDATELREEFRELVKQLKIATDIDISAFNDELDKAYSRKRELQKDKSKLLQNEIIKIHNVVFSHPQVKNLMVQKLSVDEARKNAEFIDGLVQKKEKYSTPISDRYQQEKLMSGAIGKLGTAAYSLDVVGQSLFEQAHWNLKTLRLVTADEENRPVYLRVKFGKVLSDGKLGQQTTLSEGDGISVSRNGDRNISDVHSERQNFMVDNPIEEVASRVHLNDYTMSVDKVLNMLGFDKGNDGHNISFLFISQPIIKKYVEMMEARNSNTAEYEENKKEKIIAELLGEYANDPTDSNVYDEMMDNITFTNEIVKGETNSAFQAAVLKKFIQLEKYGKYIISIQTAINVDSKGVGKNLFEVTEKLNAIKNLFTSVDKTDVRKSGYIENIGELIGEYDKVGSTQEKNDKLKEGFVVIKRIVSETNVEPDYLMVKPGTVAGAYAIHSLVSADALWSHFFPYNNNTIVNTFAQAIKLIGNSDLSESKAVEIKKLIFSEMKKYLVTNRKLDYFTLSPQEERKRLFFDAKKGSKSNHQSLATFIKSIMDSKDSALNPIKSNRLLNRLEFDLNTNGKPSFVKLLNGIGQNFDETYIYDAIIELIDENIPLGEFNGKKYTSIDLAQDLVLYAYMEGGVQQAIQFVKFIPVSYLKLINMDKVLNKEMGDIAAMLGASGDKVGTFLKQFMQHNPQLAKRLTPEMMKNGNIYETVEQGNKDDLLTLNKFMLTSLNSEGKHYPFLSVYNEKLPKGESKFQLYAYMEDETGESMYIRIPVLGCFGMSEYSMGDEGNISLVNQPNYIYPMNTSVIPLEEEDIPTDITSRFDIKRGELADTVALIAKADTPTGNLAKTILKMGLVSPSTVLITDTLSDNNGTYDRTFDIITISESMLNDPEITDDYIATVVMREVVHSITDREILQYAATNLQPGEEFRIAEDTPTRKVPDHIKRLFSLFKETQKHLKENRNLDKYFSQKFKSNNPSEADEIYDISYGGKNILEFVERMLTSPKFQEEMSNIEFKESEKSLTQKFFEWISTMFKELSNSLGIKDIDENSITANALESIFTILTEKEKVYNDQRAEEEARAAANEANITLADLGEPVDPEVFFNEPREKHDFDKKGLINDEFDSLDPKVLHNIETLQVSIANMIDSGILKVKC